MYPCKVFLGGIKGRSEGLTVASCVKDRLPLKGQHHWRVRKDTIPCCRGRTFKRWQRSERTKGSECLSATAWLNRKMRAPRENRRGVWTSRHYKRESIRLEQGFSTFVSAGPHTYVSYFMQAAIMGVRELH
ncbi:hypothetical protein TNCV_3848911 [Trichonephila clavipes]|uniref:Uncharacterized protein n=1 Tax=Trichonephila clavipes TaxID=2585209 RepID=A0A8X6US33_TRICX|nr:hypothetical protein TNCV_3848911 [Trichonephila clavipes]